MQRFTVKIFGAHPWGEDNVRTGTKTALGEHNSISGMLAEGSRATREPTDSTTGADWQKLHAGYRI